MLVSPDFIRDRIEQQVRAAFLRALRRCRYRKSESHWVGGEHTTVVVVGDKTPDCWGGSEVVWHKKHTWKGTNSMWKFWIRPNWIDRVEQYGLGVVSGQVCIDAEEVPPSQWGVMPDFHPAYRLWLVTTVAQSRGVSLKTQPLYVAKYDALGLRVIEGNHRRAIRGLHAEVLRHLGKTA